MAIKYPIIKHRAFFKTLTFIFANNEDICLKFLPDTYDLTLTLMRQILHLTWESPTHLWTFKLLMRAG